MGTFINRGNLEFQEFVTSDYVDKTGLISAVSDRLCKQGRYSCVSRCRRFGKSMAAKMLCAYYDKSCNSRRLFEGLAIEKDPSFEVHLNKYNVLFLDVTAFTTRPQYRGHIVKSIQEEISKEVKEAFPQLKYSEGVDLMGCLQTVYKQAGERFFFVIDEWDAICRETPTEMEEYVMLLRNLFKTDDSDNVFVGAYITGILPIVKYKTESALNNFWEYSMVDPGGWARYFGFTQCEVEKLCQKSGLEYEEMQKWYDGYRIGDEPCMFNPSSVMKAVVRCEFSSYWAATGSYDNVVQYIKMNYDGLKDDVIKMLSGETCKVNTTKFRNDMASVASRDDVLTVLIHLGYLAYNKKDKTCYIPNKEVRDELINAVEDTDWDNIIKVLRQSEELLEATLRGDTARVASGIDAAHSENTSILSYNDENSLSCVLSLAYIYARNEYIIHRELATGKGFADLVFVPRREVDYPAMVIELKYDHTADAAINQIHRKTYHGKALEYTDNLLLVGINYDKTTKQHSCCIERYQA